MVSALVWLLSPCRSDTDSAATTVGAHGLSAATDVHTEHHNSEPVVDTDRRFAEEGADRNRVEEEIDRDRVEEVAACERSASYAGVEKMPSLEEASQESN